MAGAEDKKTVVKKNSKKEKSGKLLNICGKHDVNNNEIFKIQTNLLNWYDNNQRVLPWREIAKSESDPNIRGYSVWVSEIMLQQTQVATVISYYNKWMEKWPTVEALASATLEEVNKVWAGLGYYSRAKRLHEGAKIIVEKLNGCIPQSVDDLMNLIPGIGLYSASAIASVAFQKPVGVVDGNVIRVLSRMRVIGAHVTESGVRDHLWNIANKIVSTKRPGDFNQALMELGAVVCTPQNPKCSECPVNACCNAYFMAKTSSTTGGLDKFLKKNTNAESNAVSESEVPDIENAVACQFCLEPSLWKENPQVTAFPCKVEKKTARIEKVGVVVIKRDNSFLITKRPDKGLLAGLWEFPSIIFADNSSTKQNTLVIDSMLSKFGIPASVVKKRKYIGEVIHIFSHIRTTYVVEYLELISSVKVKNVPKEVLWSTEEEIKTSAISTAMKKVFAAVKKDGETDSKDSKHISTKKRKMNPDDGKQRSIKSFFT